MTALGLSGGIETAAEHRGRLRAAGYLNSMSSRMMGMGIPRSQSRMAGMVNSFPKAAAKGRVEKSH
jgi:hypothetical protein